MLFLVTHLKCSSLQPRPLKSVNVHVDERDHGQSYRTFAATFEEAAVPSGSFRYSGGRYIRRCLLRYYPNDRTASIELPSLESARKLDCRKANDGGPPTSITIGPVPPKANPLSGDFLRERHLCQKWVPRGAAPRAGSSLLASPTMVRVYILFTCEMVYCRLFRKKTRLESHSICTRLLCL